jgi:hypothetical protein
MRRVAAVDVAGPAFRRLVEDVASLAGRELRSAGMGGRGLAAIPGRSADVLDERNGSIARSLEELRRWARELTPGDEFGPGRPATRFGIFARSDPAQAYEKRWARAQQPIEEQLALDTQIGALTGYSRLSQQLDERLTSYVDDLAQADPTRADILRRELLLEVRRRRGEILTQLTVATQGRAALRIIEENNLELIDAVTSATTGTIGVLQTAALVRQALSMRRHLQAGLRQGDLANRDGGGQVPETETLQQAWADVGETLNQVERLRRQVSESAALLTRSDLR